MDLAAPWEVFARFEPGYPAGAARVFLVLMVPVWLYMAWFDMARLKILNGLVLFTFGAFVLLGPFLLPLPLYALQLAQAVVVLLIMMVLFAAGTMGGGDAKFIAAASPYFLRHDLPLVLSLFVACALGAFAAHRVARLAGADRAAPLWLSWRTGRRFPLGFALGGVVCLYLAMAGF